MSFHCVLHSLREWRRFLVAVCLTFLVSNHLLAQFPTIELRTISPAGATIGSTIDCRIASGTTTEEVDRLIFSHPGIVATVKTADPLPFSDQRQTQYGQFSVTVAADVPEGIYDAIAIGRFGASNPRSFLITKGTQQSIPNDHATPETSIPLESGKWIHSWLRGQQRNHYRVHVEAGEALQLICMAKGLDSRAEPLLVLKNAAGREVARARAIGTGPTVIEWKAIVTEDLILTVNDLLFRGGEELFYYLGRFPLSETEDASMRVAQWNDFRNPASIGIQQALLDPNQLIHDEKVEATTVTIPSLIAGRLEAPSDIDQFIFDAKANETYYCDVFSEGLDQSTDPRLIAQRVVSGTDGKVTYEPIVVQDDQPAIGGAIMPIGGRDPRAVIKIGQDSQVRIQVVDQQTGPRNKNSNRYYLRLSQAKPKFQAVAYFDFPSNNAAQSRPFGALLARGGTISVRVVCKRSCGFDGALTLQAVGFPAGISCRDAVIHPTQNEAELVISAAEDAPAWAGPIAITVVAKQGDQEIVTRAYSATLRVGPTAERGLPQPRLCQDLWLAVSDQELAPVQINATEGNVLEVAKGAKIALPIKAIRRAGGADKLILRPQSLPPKAALGEVPIEGNAAEANPEIQIAGDTPAGDYSFWFQTETKIKVKVNPQALARHEAYRANLQKIFEDPNRAADKPAVETAIKTADQRIEQLKKETVERDIQVFLPSTTVRLKVTEPK